MSLASSSLARSTRLLRHAVMFELHKQLAFRAGFVVREVLRNVARPLVMICVYWALFTRGEVESLAGYDFPTLVRYMVLVAVLQRVLFNERMLDLAEQIFNGSMTKYLVLPFRFDVLFLARFVEHTLLQLGFACAIAVALALAAPRWWPDPPSVFAAAQALTLLVLGSYAYFRLTYVVQLLAFWLDAVWSLVVLTRFVVLFVAGVLVPVTVMPAAVQSVFRWLFPYWTINAPIEIWLGRQGGEQFALGLCVLAAQIAALELARIAMWRRGRMRYAGAGM